MSVRMGAQAEEAEERKMDKQYFVLSEWEGRTGDGSQKYGKLSEFGGLEEALGFARQHMSERPVMGMTYGNYGEGCRPKDLSMPYLVASSTPYWSECGDYDSVYRKYLAARCSEVNIEKTMDALTKKDTDRMYVGLEVSLFPYMGDKSGGA